MTQLAQNLAVQVFPLTQKGSIYFEVCLFLFQEYGMCLGSAITLLLPTEELLVQQIQQMLMQPTASAMWSIAQVLIIHQCTISLYLNDACLVNGNWSEWEDGPDGCSVTCGSGSVQQNRSCSNPVPQYGGEDCIGEITQTVPCNNFTCPRKDTVLD